MKIARIGQGNHKKAWKQEIRREHNSNPLQRHEHVQYTVYRLCSRSIYQLPSTTSCHSMQVTSTVRAFTIRMDGLCVYLHVFNTACIRNINSSQIIMIICPHIPKWKGIGHHPTSKNCVFILYWPGKHGKLPVHVIDVVTDWSYALVGFLVSMLFCGSPGQS